MHFKVCRFYGWTLSETLALDTDDFNDAYLAITAIEAQETLVNQQTALYPNMKDESREKIKHELMNMAFPNREAEALTIDQLAVFLGSK